MDKNVNSVKNVKVKIGYTKLNMQTSIYERTFKSLCSH